MNTDSSTVTRVEKHIIKQNNKWFDMLMKYCHLSKNLYNHANFVVRNKFISENVYIKYSELDKLLKCDAEYPDYRNMPTAQSRWQRSQTNISALNLRDESNHFPTTER